MYKYIELWDMKDVTWHMTEYRQKGCSDFHVLPTAKPNEYQPRYTLIYWEPDRSI